MIINENNVSKQNIEDFSSGKEIDRMSFFDLFAKIKSMAKIILKQDEIINTSLSNEYTVDTLLANLNNDKLSDKEFRAFVKTLAFKQPVKEQLKKE